jgi:DNA-binding NarL/FixJ family response regulator
MPINVTITDDHPLAVAGLKNMLFSYDNIEVRHTYSNGAELLAGLKTEQPDVLLLDVQLPDIKGDELAKSIHTKYPNIKILAITSLDAPIHVKAMLRNGCTGYLLKNTDVQTLINAIEEVHKGVEYIEPSIKEQMLQNLLHYRKQPSTKMPSLTRRETEILHLIIEEKTNQQIADKLFLSLRTIENHRFSLFQKLNVNNTVGLVKVAIQLGLIQ